MTQSFVRENLERVQERIAAAARKAGRRVDEITLIGVSKTHPAESIRDGVRGGAAALWRESRAGVGREARRASRIWRRPGT